VCGGMYFCLTHGYNLALCFARRCSFHVGVCNSVCPTVCQCGVLKRPVSVNEKRDRQTVSAIRFAGGSRAPRAKCLDAVAIPAIRVLQCMSVCMSVRLRRCVCVCQCVCIGSPLSLALSRRVSCCVCLPCRSLLCSLNRSGQKGGTNTHRQTDRRDAPASFDRRHVVARFSDGSHDHLRAR
jgi:hypothetical protein